MFSYVATILITGWVIFLVSFFQKTTQFGLKKADLKPEIILGSILLAATIAALIVAAR